MSQIVTDDFNRANGALGANWTTVAGQAAFTIVSNQAQGPSAQLTSGAVAYTGAGWTGGADQYAEFAIKTNASVNDGGPTCRSSTAAQTFYVACINNSDTVALGSSQAFQVFRVVAGTFTQVGSTVNMVIAANDVLRCEAQGTTIRGFVNGVQKVTGTDSSIASGNPGMEFWHGGTAGANLTTMDDFAAGDFTAAGGQVPYQPQYQGAPVMAQ